MQKGETNPVKIQKNVKEAIGGKFPLYSLGFGFDVSFEFLNKLSLENKGVARRIYEDSDADLQLQGFYEEVAIPLLTDVQLNYQGVGNLTQSTFNQYYNGSEIVVAGQITDNSLESFTTEVIALSKSTKVVYHSNVPTGDLDIPQNKNFIKRLWAFLTVKQLLEKMVLLEGLEKDNAKKEALALSLKYKFVTPLTSLVVTKPQDEEMQIMMDRAALRLILLGVFLISAASDPVGKKENVDIYSFYINSTVTSRYATTVITSRVANTLNESQEIQFEVKIPKNAFISKFRMTIEGKTYDGVVKEKEEAQQQYNQAVSRGQSAGLIKSVGRTLEDFKTSVTVAAFSKVTFELTYEELLKRRLGKYELLINAQPMQPVADFKMDVHIQEKPGISFLEVKGDLSTGDLANAIKTTRADKDAWVTFYPTRDQQTKCKSCGENGMNGNLLITYDVERRNPKGEVMVSNGYFVHYFAPSDVPRIPKNVVFIIDQSGSMHGRKIEQTRLALLRILSDLDEDDHFGLITFDSEVSLWKRELLKATETNLENAKSFVKEIRDRGGETNIEKIMANVKGAIGTKFPLYCLGFGYDVNFDFLTKMSLENGGVARRIYEDSDADLQLQGFYDEVAVPLLTDIQLKYPGGTNLTKTSFGLYFNGSEIVVSGQITDNSVESFTTEVIAVSKGSNVMYQDTIMTKDPSDVPPENEDFMQRLWAYLTVQQLLERQVLLKGQEKEDKKKEALKLSLKYKFVTPLTSMVVTKPQEGDVEVADKPKEGETPPRPPIMNLRPIPHGAAAFPGVRVEDHDFGSKLILDQRQMIPWKTIVATAMPVPTVRRNRFVLSVDGQSKPLCFDVPVPYKLRLLRGLTSRLFPMQIMMDRAALRLILLGVFIISVTSVPIKKKENVDIYSFYINSTVTSRYTTTVITSRVANTLNESQEIQFEVKIPKNAFISKFRMTIEGKTYDGVVKEKEEAQQQYNQAVSRGQSAGLIKSVGRTLEDFKTSVTVAAFSKVTFELTYEELLKRRLGKYELLINAQPMQPVADFKMDVHIQEKPGISFLEVKGDLSTGDLANAIKTTRADKDAWVTFYPTRDQQTKCKSCGENGLNGNLLITYDVERRNPKGEVMVSNGYFVHYFAPSDVPRIPKNVVFIIDQSGSMHGRKIEQTRLALLRILSDLDEDDHFGLITFDSEVSLWKRELLKATETNLENAKSFVKEIRDRGSETNIEKIMANVKEAIGTKFPLYCLGFGYDVNFDFLTKMSLENGGVARRIYEDSDADLQLQGFYDEVAVPLLTDIQLKYPGGTNLTKTSFGLYFNGSEIVVSGQITDNSVESFTTEVIAVSKGSNVMYQDTIMTKGPSDVPPENEDFMQRLWAYLTVQQLLERQVLLKGQEKEDKKKEALKLSLKYKFVTPLTSMVVTKPQEGDVEVADKPKEGETPPRPPIMNLRPIPHGAAAYYDFGSKLIFDQRQMSGPVRATAMPVSTVRRNRFVLSVDGQSKPLCFDVPVPYKLRLLRGLTSRLFPVQIMMDRAALRLILLGVFIISVTSVPIKKKENVDIYSFYINSTVTSRFATTVITSRVANKLNESQEIQFEVKLPKNAFISKFRMTIEGKTYDGVVKGKEEAQQQYSRAVSQGQSAGLIKSVGRTLEDFKTSVTVAAFSKVTFELTYEELLQRRLGRYELLINAQPMQPVADFKLDVHIQEKPGISFLEVKGDLSTDDLANAIKTTRADKDAWVTFYPTRDQQTKCKSCGENGMNGDLLITYDVERKNPKGEVVVSNGYFVHYFAPSDVPRIAKNVVFVIDRSGSMHGRKIEQTRLALLRILSDLDEDDHFGLITFDSEVSLWKRELLKATETNLENAKSFVKEIRDRGGETNIQKIMANVKGAIGTKFPLYCLGFGYDVNFDFLTKMSLENSGVARRIYEDSDADLQLQGFYDEVAVPLLTDIQLKYPGGTNLTKTSFGLYFNGSEIVVSGQITDNSVESFTTEVIAVSRGSNVMYQDTIMTKDPSDVPPENEDFMQRLWAYLTVKQLLERQVLLKGQEQEDAKKEALKLSLKYQFVTPLTSMVVTKPQEGEVEVADKPKEGETPPRPPGQMPMVHEEKIFSVDSVSTVRRNRFVLSVDGFSMNGDSMIGRKGFREIAFHYKTNNLAINTRVIKYHDGPNKVEFLWSQEPTQHNTEK
ncbi:inter-alpha-trypsin inhibitor heavy chain H3-like isoform X1 [Labeo rohita]|uniref:Inter-alpha-trypsin inhibitor heavy chain H3-like isoform X1 n=1 Tax=Labeo rohita TaxID=84645 RepID=A0A498MUL6_LABRO|nr:inter-alpha-trypsin inhibitor heavy chain H3-like isoform X1 [Labeo rohita]